jgi:putative hydrolase of HD superfamily
MQTKANNPSGLLEGKDILPLVNAYFELNHLKQLYRQGWLQRGVDKSHCESVADHSFCVAVLTFWLVQIYFPNLDICRAIQLALIHDLGEIYAGDITPADQVEHEEKQRLEKASIHRVVEKLPNAQIYLSLWEEFETGTSPEARLVRQVDRLEMGLQAEIYRLQNFSGMEEFILSARQSLQDPPLLELLDEMEKL